MKFTREQNMHQMLYRLKEVSKLGNITLACKRPAIRCIHASVSGRSMLLCRLTAGIVFFYFGIIFSSPLAIACPSSGCLIIRNLETCQILYTRLLKPGDAFTYAYTHSVEKLPVREKFVISENFDLVLTETKIKSLAVLGPILAKGEKIVETKDTFYIQTQRHFKHLSLRVAYFYKQTLAFSDTLIELQQIASGGDPIELSIMSCGQ
jgi:hypothetical protein